MTACWRGVTEIASSRYGFTICAVRADGTLWCWGDPNDLGEIGDGTLRPGGSRP
ncbi:hypothetical protein [Sorangium sp. So ce136]|uniref:hypothetical protein n=1 Tax=unclassified Sorangium TaxID=2621164 RepID=UPI003F521680